MFASSSAADAATGTRANTITASSLQIRVMNASSQGSVRFLAGGAGGWAPRWLARSVLLRQDELVGPRDSEPVLLDAVDDNELARVLEEVRARHDPPCRTLRRTRSLIGRLRRRRGHRAPADRAPIARRPLKKSAPAVIRYSV